jgi:predicted nucleic acid-binding protein
MKIVIDANITIALFVNLPYSSQAERLFRLWRRQDVELFAPALWPAEVVSALRKVVTAGQIGSDDARLSLASLEHFPIQVVVPDAALMDSSLVWAEKLNQTVAYDAQYVALAERLAAEFWTADQRLLRALKPMKNSWVHWVGDVN